MEEKNSSDKKNGKGGGLLMKLLANIAVMACVSVALVWVSTIWLDAWTAHGRYAVVPDVKGMPYDAAVRVLNEGGFDVELTDSVYDTKMRPGEVVDQSPNVNAKVKEGRLVYLTVNAFSPRMITLPNLVDTSLRQARSILEGLGVKNIKVVEVPSDFKNLVLAVKRDGVRLSTGARVSINSHIVLEVGAGAPEENLDSIAPVDSVVMEPVDLI